MPLTTLGPSASWFTHLKRQVLPRGLVSLRCVPKGNKRIADCACDAKAAPIAVRLSNFPKLALSAIVSVWVHEGAEMAHDRQNIRGSVPWNDEFDQFLMRVADGTYSHSGDDLLHEIHKTAIEANWINIRLYRNVMRLLWAILAVSLAILLRTFT